MRRLITPTIAIMIMAAAARAEHYNTATQQRAAQLPAIIHTAAGITVRPTADQLRASGWLLDPIRPALVPSGHAVTSRRIDVSALGIPWEAVQTQPIPHPPPPAPDIVKEAADVQIIFNSAGDFITAVIRESTNQPPARLIP